MSRVANNPVELPKGVEATLTASDIFVKGSKGNLQLNLHESVAVSQDDLEDVNEYWSANDIPFRCIPDPEGKLKAMYDQQDTLLAQLPALFVIDTQGVLKLAHYGDGMKDIPTVQELLRIVEN